MCSQCTYAARMPYRNTAYAYDSTAPTNGQEPALIVGMPEELKKDWEGYLDRWTAAGLLNQESAGRIRAWQYGQPAAPGPNWPTKLALAFGAILLAAGILLFVSAHWDELSP